MLIRPDGTGVVVVIGQASHAWLSGQLARAWGNDRFSAPAPREEVCLAAEQHDVGMAERDLAPRLHPSEGRPLSFMEMALEDHLRLWSTAPDKLLTQSAYAALLVSMHGTALYERRDVDRLPSAQAGAVRDYLSREAARQERLIALLGADREQARRNQRLLFCWDGMSLALCLRWDDFVAGGVPTSGGARADVAVRGAGVSDRVTLSAIDMVNADQAPGGPFGLVIFSLNALMHLTTPGLQLAALSAAFAALDPKGQLIIDTLDPSPSHLTQLESGHTLEGSWDRPDGSTVDKWSHRHIHPATQRIDTILWYDQSFPDGRLTRTRTRFPLRYVHASELELMLRLAGFSETRFYGNYDLEPYEDDAERLFVTSEVTASKRQPRLK